MALKAVKMKFITMWSLMSKWWQHTWISVKQF
jgi:hypothetical protein